MKNVVRLKDIAEKLNTSVNTVSHALRDLPDISQEMKEKVRNVASELGYVANTVASDFRTGSTKTIGIIIDDMLNPYYMLMNDIIVNDLLEKNYLASFFRINETKNTTKVLQRILERRFDGILSFIELDEEFLNLCRKIGLPVVLIGRKNKYAQISTVTTNDRKGGYIACQKLIEGGCKNPGYIGATKDIECSRRRKDGFRDYLEEHSIPLNQDNYIYLDSPTASVAASVQKLLDNKVDGIFFFSDLLAFDGIKYLRSINKNTPDDIKVIGYDSLCEDYVFPFNVDSISYDRNKIAKKAVSILFNQLNGDENIYTEEIDVDYFKGNTII